MRIQILDEPVRQNVELFLDIMRRVKKKQAATMLPQEKVFNAWLNRNTGQLSFALSGEESHFLGKKEWRPISFSYNYDLQNGEIQFTVQDADMESNAFDSKDIQPTAMRVLRDTMKVFHQIGEQLKGPSDFETKIAVLAKANIVSEISHVDRSILIDTWHPSDRMQAEDILKGKPAGTYFFRKDPYAEILEKQLQRQLGEKILCFTLTFSSEHHKISDYTLVHSDSTWQIYNDDPSLQQKRYAELKEVIDAHKRELKYPLYHPVS